MLGRRDPADLLAGAGAPVGFHLGAATTLDDGIVILRYRTDGALADAA